MNLNGLINMVMRLFARKAVRAMTRGTTGRAPKAQTPRGGAAGGGAAASTQREAAKRARQAAKITRRLGR